MKKRLGLIINPIAGVGGAVGLKGSDGAEIQRTAMERGAVKKSIERTRAALELVTALKENIVVYTAGGEMGRDLAVEMGFETVVVHETGQVTTAADTLAAAKALGGLDVDALLFSGGDGTARDVCASLAGDITVVGVPAGVKIHSAVYAITPETAGKALYACLTARISTRQAEVMDIDETMYRAGRLQAKLYGYLPVPVLCGVMQNPKAASHNSEDNLGGICEEVKDFINRQKDVGACHILGAGSTVMAIKAGLAVDGSLLGIDVVQNGVLIAKDATEAELIDITGRYTSHLFITPIGGQGHIFGRGNQQLSPVVIRQIGPDNICVVAAASKIYSLPDQSLYVDTGDSLLDEKLRGYRRVVVGWQQTLVCKVN